MTTTTEISLDKYAGKEEAAVARRLVRKAIEAGYKLSVNDGEEWTVKGSTDRKAVLEALASTGADTIRVRTMEGAKVGDLNLIYQNGPGDELIADYSDNPATNALYQMANKQPIEDDRIAQYIANGHTLSEAMGFIEEAKGFEIGKEARRADSPE